MSTIFAGVYAGTHVALARLPNPQRTTNSYNCYLDLLAGAFEPRMFLPKTKHDIHEFVGLVQTNDDIIHLYGIDRLKFVQHHKTLSQVLSTKEVSLPKICYASVNRFGLPRTKNDVTKVTSDNRTSQKRKPIL